MLRLLFVKLFEKLPLNIKNYFKIIILGLSASFITILYQILIKFLYNNTFIKFKQYDNFHFLIYSFITVFSTSLLAGILGYKFSKDSGLGISQVKVAYKKDMGYIPFNSFIYKFIASVLTVGGGTSLGKEGPSVYLGASISSNIDGFLGTPKNFRRKAIVIGSATALSAAFNTPLSGILFVIEEIVNDFDNKFLGEAILASVIGALSVHATMGKNPAFNIPDIGNSYGFKHYFILPFIAIICSLVSIFFKKSILFFRKKIKKINFIPNYIKPLIAGIITWIIGAAVFIFFNKVGIFGLGYEDLSEIFLGNFPVNAALALFLGKLLATIFAFCFGGLGGIFAPILFIGGTLSYFLAKIFSGFVLLNNEEILILTIAGMSSSLATLIKAPLTSIFIVFEMTHEFAVVPALTLAVFISIIINKIFNNKNIYDELIEQDNIELPDITIKKNLNLWQFLKVKDIMHRKVYAINLSDINYSKKILEDYNFISFPVFIFEPFTKENCLGLIKKELALSIFEKEIDKNIIENKIKEKIEKIDYCFEEEELKDVANKFTKSLLLLVLSDDKSQNNKDYNLVIGILSIHDLVRAQVLSIEG
jgi:CIC family chloride channel protein